MKEKNAKIVSTMLGYEDHGIFTFMLQLDYGGSGQGAGGYGLDEWNETLSKREGTKYGMDMLIAILETVGVREWEELVGKYVRVKTEHDKVHAIGHPLKDKWLNFEHFSKKYFSEQYTEMKNRANKKEK